MLDGKSSGVSDSSELAGRVPTGTTVLANTGISEAKLKHDCPIAKQTKSFDSSSARMKEVVRIARPK